MVVFSDGFESGDFTGWDTTYHGGTTVTTTVSDTIAKEGTYSLHSDNDNGWGGTGDGTEEQLASTYSTLYYRTYLYTEDLTAIDGHDTDRHIRIMAIRGDTSSNWEDNIVEVRLWGTATSGSFQWGFSYLDGAGMSISKAVAESVSEDKWFCVEVKVVVGNGAGSVTLYVDGVQKVEETSLDNDADGDVEYVLIGMLYIQGWNGENCEIYQDSAIVDTSYIGPEAAGGPTIKKGSNLATTMMQMLNSKLFFDAVKLPSCIPRRFP